MLIISPIPYRSYGNIAVIKALIDAGATTNISDDNGRLPHTRAKKQCTDEANKQTSMELLMSAMKEEYERSKDTYVYPPVRRAEELCQMGDILSPRKGRG